MTAKETRGAASVLIVVWLPVLLVVAALVVDAGILFVAKYQFQAAVDLAALSAVQSVEWELLGEGVVQINEEDAVFYADDYLSANTSSLLDANPETLKVWVVNATEEQPLEHPLSGKDLEHPTVIIQSEMKGPASVFDSWLTPLVLSAEADASIRPRTRP